MKKILSVLWMWILSLFWIICFANSMPDLPDGFLVEVNPSSFSVNDVVDLKITAIKNWKTMKNYEWYFDITVIDKDWFLLQSNDVTLPDGWWWAIRIQDNWVREYKNWLKFMKHWKYTVSVTEFTNDSVWWQTTITVSWNWTITSSQIEHNASPTMPDSFQVEVNPSSFSVNEKADLTITAIKNWKIMRDYEWYFDIVVYDTNWNLLQSNSVTVPEGWWWSILLQDSWVKKYSKWLILKKPGKYKVSVSEFTNADVVWETTITVLWNGSISNLSNDWTIKLLNQKWITIHNTWNEFKPNQWLRRDEAAKMLGISNKYISNWINLANASSCSFNDLDNAWADLKDVIKESCKLWLFKGNNWKFNPSQSITNAQVLTVIGRMLYWMQDESWEHYAKAYIDKLTADWYLSVIKLDRNDWDKQAKRWDIAKILWLLIH